MRRQPFRTLSRIKFDVTNATSLHFGRSSFPFFNSVEQNKIGNPGVPGNVCGSLLREPINQLLFVFFRLGIEDQARHNHEHIAVRSVTRLHRPDLGFFGKGVSKTHDSLDDALERKIETIVAKKCRDVFNVVISANSNSNSHINPVMLRRPRNSRSLGASLKGTAWGRTQDAVGLAGVINGLAPSNRNFLAADGMGINIGDGALNCSGEKIIAADYLTRLTKATALTLDYQFIGFPAYNSARGPANIILARHHAQF